MRGIPLRSYLVTLLVAIALTSGAVPMLRPITVFAASAVLDDSQKLYDSAKFDDAITKLRGGLSTGTLTGSDAINARALMARCLVKAGKRLEAKEAFKSILRQDEGFRLDGAVVPPDEMDIFTLATKELRAEQIEAGRRIPASISLVLGTGGGQNKDLSKNLNDIGNDFDSKFKTDVEVGGSVRFPLRPRLSLDIQLTHLGGKNQNHATNDSDKVEVKISSLPVVVSLYYTLLPREKYRVSAFAGGGPMLATNYEDSFNFFRVVPLSISDQRVGVIAQAGLEGEYLISSRVSVSGRVLGRSADTSKMFSTGFFSKGPVSDFTVSWSGFGAFVALRAYIGY